MADTETADKVAGMLRLAETTSMIADSSRTSSTARAEAYDFVAELLAYTFREFAPDNMLTFDVRVNEILGEIARWGFSATAPAIRNQVARELIPSIVEIAEK